MSRWTVLFVVVLVVWMGGCGEGCQSTETLSQQDAELVGYIVDFERLYDLQVTFEVTLIDYQLSGDVDNIGMCVLRKEGPPSVLLERKFWLEASPMLRRAVIYHELGHCALGLDHNDRLRTMSVIDNTGELVEVEGPYSLMHSQAFSERYYNEPHFTYYYVPQLQEERKTQSGLTAPGSIVCTFKP